MSDPSEGAVEAATEVLKELTGCGYASFARPILEAAYAIDHPSPPADPDPREAGVVDEDDDDPFSPTWRFGPEFDRVTGTGSDYPGPEVLSPEQVIDHIQWLRSMLSSHPGWSLTLQDANENGSMSVGLHRPEYLLQILTDAPPADPDPRIEAVEALIEQWEAEAAKQRANAERVVANFAAAEACMVRASLHTFHATALRTALGQDDQRKDQP